MVNRRVFDFLKTLARQPELRHRLRTRPKAEVLAHARETGYEFSEHDFDDTIWGVEMFLAGKVGEPFDLSFSLWDTMWGKYYLDYLVDNVGKALTEGAIEDFLSQRR